MSQSTDGQIDQFYVEAHNICTEAVFIINSLPNAEILAVERILHQLDAIRDILLHLEDPFTLPSEQDELLDHLDSLIMPLEEFLAHPPPPANANVPRESTGRRGRPSYTLDLGRVQELHNLGLSWQDIASTYGVSRKTLYNHLRGAGLSTSKPEYADVSDEDLDDIVSEISRAHPLCGSTIIHGHLEARGIHVPLQRVQQSLRRVDAVGVLIRCVSQPTPTLRVPPIRTNPLSLAGGLVSSSVECTEFEDRTPCGTSTAMRNCGLGGSMCTDASTVTHASSSTSPVAQTSAQQR